MDEAASTGAQRSLTGRRDRSTHPAARLRRQPLVPIKSNGLPPKPTDEQLVNGCLKALGRDRVRSTRAKNWIVFYRVIHKRACAFRTATGRTSWTELALALWDDVDPENIHSRIRSMKRWARDLEAAGFLRVWGERDERGAFRCLRWELTSPERGYSSVGKATRAHVTHSRARRHRFLPRRRPNRRGNPCERISVFFGEKMPTPSFTVGACPPLKGGASEARTEIVEIARFSPPAGGKPAAPAAPAAAITAGSETAGPEGNGRLERLRRLQAKVAELEALLDAEESDGRGAGRDRGP